MDFQLKNSWIPYIRLSMHHGFSANSTQKQCIKSMRINISQNPSETFNLPDLQDCVKFTRMHFSRLWYSHEHGGLWMHTEKTDIRYTLKTLVSPFPNSGKVPFYGSCLLTSTCKCLIPPFKVNAFLPWRTLRLLKEIKSPGTILNSNWNPKFRYRKNILKIVCIKQSIFCLFMLFSIVSKKPASKSEFLITISILYKLIYNHLKSLE